jgi:hypothetical protein
MGDYNKYLAQYNKYSPYLKFGMNLAKGGNVAKAGTEAMIDKTLGSVPGYGDIYKGVKLFNDTTGGVNFNKMLGIKNPLTQGWNKLWGVKPKKSPEEEQAADPEYAKYMSMLSDMQNSSASTERSALEKRKSIQPMREKAVEDYMDILQNGLSSRQLAPVYAAGESRNRVIGAAAESGLMQQVQNRGMGGGIQAGLEAAVQANRNNLSADLNSRITGQQIAARPGMLGQAANMTMGMENQIQQELAQAANERLNAANVGLQAYNANQTNKRYADQIAFEKENAANTERGLLLAKFGPDIAKSIKNLINKEKPEKVVGDVAEPDPMFNGIDAGGDWLGTNDTPMGSPPPSIWAGGVPKFDPLHTADDVSIPPTVSGLGGFNNPTGGDLGLFGQTMSPNMRVTPDVENFLNGQHPYAQQGETKMGPGGATYVKTMFGWQKYYQKNTSPGSPRQQGVQSPKVFQAF